MKVNQPSKPISRFAEIAFASIAVLLFIFVGLDQNSRHRQTPAPQPKPSNAPVKSQGPEPTVSKEGPPPNLVTQDAPQLSGRELARVRFAELLQAIYDKEGRRIQVRAVGERHETLELSSALITKGSYTLEAAERETANCPDCLEIIRKAGFKSIVITGSRYEREWSVK